MLINFAGNSAVQNGNAWQLFYLFVSLVVGFCIIGAAIWVYRNFILPSIPEPGKAFANIFVGLVFLGILLWIFLLIF